MRAAPGPSTASAPDVKPCPGMNSPPDAKPGPLRILRRVYQPDSFKGAVLTLLSGSSLAVGLSFLAQPVLTRLYDPAAFGMLDSFIALVAVLAPLISLRYEDALMLPADDEDAAHVFWLSTMLLLAATALAALAVYVLPAAVLIHAPLLEDWGWLLPAALMIFRGSKLLEYWLTRQQHFRSVAAAHLAEALVKMGVRVAAAVALAGVGVAGLLGGYVAGLLAAGLLLLWLIRRAKLQLLIKHVSLVGMRRAARRFRNFPRYSAPSQLCYALATRLPFLLLLVYFGEATVGQFGRAFVILAVPMSVLGASIARVYTIRGVEARRSSSLAATTARLHDGLVRVALFPALAIVVAGPALLAVYFGDEWQMAGHFLRYVGPWFLLAGIASTLTPVFDVLERQREDLLTSLLLFVLPTAALLVGGYIGRIVPAMILLGIMGAASRIYHIHLMLSLAGVMPRQRIRPYVQAGAHAVPLLLVLLLIYLFLPPLATAAATLLLIGAHLWHITRHELFA